MFKNVHRLQHRNQRCVTITCSFWCYVYRCLYSVVLYLMGCTMPSTSWREVSLVSWGEMKFLENAWRSLHFNIICTTSLHMYTSDTCIIYSFILTSIHWIDWGRLKRDNAAFLDMLLCLICKYICLCNMYGLMENEATEARKEM